MVMDNDNLLNLRERPVIVNHKEDIPVPTGISGFRDPAAFVTTEHHQKRKKCNNKTY